MLNLTLPVKPKEVNGKYEFLVTEVYLSDNKDVYVSYHTHLPAESVEVNKQGKEYMVVVDDASLPLMNQKKPLDIMIYPVLNK